MGAGHFYGWIRKRISLHMPLRHLFHVDIPVDSDLMTIMTNASTLNVNATNTIYIENKISWYLWAVGPPLFILLGTIGNVLTIFVLRRRAMKSVRFFLTALAVVDTVMLYDGFAHDWLYRITTPRIVIRYLSPVTCKMQLFLLVTCKWSSAWILVAITIQRFLSVLLPLKAKTICSRRVPCITLLTIITFSAAVNSHFFFTFGPAIVGSGNKTTFHNCQKIKPIFLGDIWPWIDAAFGSFIPFFVLIVCNVGILGKLIQAKSRMRIDGAKTKTPSEENLATTTAMLLTVSFMFLLLTAPYFLWRLIRPYFPPAPNAKSEAQWDLAYKIAQFLQYTNYAVNFLLYCVSGSTFRTELKAVLHCQSEAYSRRKTFMSKSSSTVLVNGNGMYDKKKRYQFKSDENVEMNGGFVNTESDCTHM